MRSDAARDGVEIKARALEEERSRRQARVSRMKKNAESDASHSWSDVISAGTVSVRMSNGITVIRSIQNQLRQ